MNHHTIDNFDYICTHNKHHYEHTNKIQRVYLAGETQNKERSMAKDLTTSEISRQNILNNPVALPRIREALDIKPLEFNGVLYVTKQMAADFYGVDLRTITNCLNANEEELKRNGYKVLQGKDLKDFKLHFAKEIDFPTKTTVLGVFDFRSFLNIGMLLTTSEKAKQVRSTMLDIVIAVINEKTGGGTKYINRRDRNYVISPRHLL